VSGLYILMLKDQTFFFADTTVNIDPTAEQLAEIALLTADAVRRFDIEPRLALVSFSNFGSNTHASALKVKRAVELVRAARPDLPVDGEMQADFAVVPEMLEESYPWATVKSPNILIFPNLEAANAAYSSSGDSPAPGDRTDPSRNGAAGPRPPARSGCRRHRQHGRDRRRGRPGEGSRPPQGQTP
jgi:phosphotransacetylase